MSMLDSFFSKGFKAAKCKTLLKLTIPRIKLLRNRREIQLRQMRRDIAKLLETGQEATARIRVEHIIREENMMAAQEILELFCELIAVRLPIIETQRECPLDLKEAISSVCFAAPRCADLPEMIQVQMLFASKYGKEFVSAATELRPDCGVNRQLIELLSVRAPSPEKKMKLLKEIAEEHELEWDPEASEAELFKTHEDLLQGPTQFVSASKLPLPQSKHEDLSQSNAGQASGESDSDFDLVDFPEVPKVALQPQSAASVPEMNTPTLGHSDSNVNNESSKLPGRADNPLQMRPLEPEQLIHESSASMKDEAPEIPTAAAEDRQFLPFITPPSHSPDSLPPKESNSQPLSRESNVAIGAYQTNIETNVDLQDVLAAAHAAADSAEKAAAAARSAASLAQARISEFTKKKNEEIIEDSSENPFYSDTAEQSPRIDKPHLEHRVSVDDLSSRVPNQENEDQQFQEEFTVHSLGNLNLGSSSPTFDNNVPSYKPTSTQPQRLNSMDDDSFFSYPNLYTPQSSNVGSNVHSFPENNRSSHDS